MSEAKKHLPHRRCIGCGISKEQKLLKRIYLKEDILCIDHLRRVEGRGMYLCHSQECAQKAFKKKAFERLLKRVISDEAKENLIKEIENE